MKAYRPDSDTPAPTVRRTVVVGGGNVAMDAARCAMRLGAEQVSVVYRRSEQEMPARKEEIEHAKEEGILFQTLTNPVQVLGEGGKATALRCVKTELGPPDASGRRRPVEIPDSQFDIEADCVIMAIGTSPNPLITSTTAGLQTNAHGCLTVSETGETSRRGVFAGGDAVTGAATVILAMGAGKEAARAIDQYLSTL
jgi:glutamate synthase (NADPH/NADH) small chain